MLQNQKTSKPSILGIDQDQFIELISAWHEPGYRVKQIWQGLYRQYWMDPGAFSNLPEGLKKMLGEYFDFVCIEPVKQLISQDRQTVKTLFQLRDGKFIESVLMRYRNRNSVCISSQSGCVLNCSFCATGQSGFGRDLNSGEIVEQVIWYARLLEKENGRISNVVVMGMGEPFLNYDNVLSAINRLNHEEGFALGKRRFTISTAGIIPGIERFSLEEKQINLAVSLHAANDELRSKLMPINKKYPIADLMAACRRYVERTNRRISFEWALIDSINDRPADAKELISLLSDLLCHVNLIPLNPIGKDDQFASSDAAAKKFKSLLETAHIPCSIRTRRGVDIQAGCGQLAGKV